jgi:hypothetical protein
MKFLYASLLLLLIIPASAETITSAMPCGDTKNITEILRERFKEIPIIVGIADDGAKSLMSLWTNIENGSWTLVATKDQLSCIIGTGKSLRIVEPGKTI